MGKKIDNIEYEIDELIYAACKTIWRLKYMWHIRSVWPGLRRAWLLSYNSHPDDHGNSARDIAEDDMKYPGIDFILAALEESEG